MSSVRKSSGAESFEVAILGGLIFCASIFGVTKLAPSIGNVFLADKSPVKVTTSSYGVKASNFDDALLSDKHIASAHQDLSIQANKTSFPARPKYPSNVAVKNVYTQPATVHSANVKYYSNTTTTNNYSPPVNNYSPSVKSYSPPSKNTAVTRVVSSNTSSLTSSRPRGMAGSAGSSVGLGTFTTGAANQPTSANRVSSGVYGKPAESSSSSRQTTAPLIRQTSAPSLGTSSSSRMQTNSGGSSVRTTSSSSSSSSSSAAQRFIALLRSLINK